MELVSAGSWLLLRMLGALEGLEALGCLASGGVCGLHVALSRLFLFNFLRL